MRDLINNEVVDGLAKRGRLCGQAKELGLAWLRRVLAVCNDFHCKVARVMSAILVCINRLSADPLARIKMVQRRAVAFRLPSCTPRLEFRPAKRCRGQLEDWCVGVL
eukprot:2732658-Alexandrium_andersonii.AAC.1